MPLYAQKYAICAFLQNMLRSHDRYKPVSLNSRQQLYSSLLYYCITHQLKPERFHWTVGIIIFQQ